jgi:hypothetical protein
MSHHINKFCTFASLENVPSENIEIGETLQGVAISENKFLLFDNLIVLGTFGTIVESPSTRLMSSRQRLNYKE